MPIPATPLCTKCLQEKSADEFVNDRTRPMGKFPWCKTCVQKDHAARFARKFPDKVRRKREGLRLCSKCKQEKLPAEFSKRGNRYKSHCKTCIAGYYVENKDEIQAQHVAYRIENPEKIREIKAAYYQENKEDVNRKQLTRTRMRRARKAAAPVVEKVTTEYIFTRDKGICQICYKPCKNRKDGHVDHVIPITKGGEHSRRNCVWTHRQCNMKKGNRVVTQQMRLLP